MRIRYKNNGWQLLFGILFSQVLATPQPSQSTYDTGTGALPISQTRKLSTEKLSYFLLATEQSHYLNARLSDHPGSSLNHHAGLPPAGCTESLSMRWCTCMLCPVGQRISGGQIQLAVERMWIWYNVASLEFRVNHVCQFAWDTGKECFSILLHNSWNLKNTS